MSVREKQISLFPEKQISISVNGVRAVNTVDLYELKVTFDSTPGEYIYMKDYVNKGEYKLHSSGAFHYFHKTKVTLLRPGLLPNYFNEPVFPWIQSVHNKSGDIRVPRVPQTRSPYPAISIGKHNKKLQMHVICAAAFIPQPKDINYCLVSHKNHMKWDYSLRNLEWNTHKGNSDGFKKERRMNPLEVFDKWWDEYTRGVDYDVDDWQKEEDQF